MVSIPLLKRSCEALVLAYSPKKVLLKDEFGKKFYIPKSEIIRKTFNSSLINLFGEDLGYLKESIFYGTKDSVGMLLEYLSSPKFNRYFSMVNGSVYKFKDERERDLAVSNFNGFWTTEEKSQWGQIWGVMEEYTQKENSCIHTRG